MRGVFSGRRRELQILQAVLDEARAKPAVAVIDGEGGIGKTTLCGAAAEFAAESGFVVLTAAGAAAEAALTWAVLADLVAGIDESVLGELAPLHQRALSALRTGVDDPGGGERLVATAFRRAVELQADQRPVLIVVDDAQWLDPPSRLALGFTVRRLDVPAAVLVVFRIGDPGAGDRSWIQPRDPKALTRLTLGPMSSKGVREMVGARLGRAPTPKTMAAIHALSGGNPLYALELARAVGDKPDGDLGALPPTLTALLRHRIGEMDIVTAEAVTIAAAAFDPSVEVVSAAAGITPAELVDILQPLESRGVLAFEGTRVRFTHPMIATGITAAAQPAVLREAHRRLSAAVDNAEQHARHLALSAPHGDPDTLKALDVAAETAASRGAYSTAAELVGMAIRLGGDGHLRRLRAADHHFRAGSLDEADSMLAPVLDDLPSGFMRTVGLLLAAAIRGYRDGLASTIGMLRWAVEEAGDDLVLRTQALLVLSLSTGIGGDMATCVELARRAREDADATGVASLRSQALTLWAHVSFMYGMGPDADALRIAWEIGEPDASAPIMLRPKPIHALHCAWTGRLEEARAELAEISRRCDEQGNELDVLWSAEQLTMIDIALGRYVDAERTAAEALDRAERIGGKLSLITAHTAVANAAAYRGQLEAAREAAVLAVTGATVAGLHYLIRHPLMSLAFVEVSSSQYIQALATLEPLMAAFDPVHDIEIMAGGFLPDAVEALVATGRVEDAEPLTAALEAGGARHGRPWMLAVGARCRALVLAGRGDLKGALSAAERAMEHHGRLPMPFERARTQLLLGQLQRRRRARAAQESLSQAAAVFEDIGSPLWAARAHSELARMANRLRSADLTASERQVAEHAGNGMSNKEIAAALYLSEKTVEMHLSSIYRKLGIRSRVQLAGQLRLLIP